MRRTLSAAIVSGLVGAALLLAPRPIIGQRASRFDRERFNGRDVVAREALVKLRQPAVTSDLAALRADGDADDVRPLGRGGAIKVRSRSMNVAALVARLAQRPDVAYAEPNFIVRMIAEPNDPQYPQLWALKNFGQPINGSPGVAGADIHTVPAWNITLGSTANVVAVIDTGIDYTHQDIAANMWSAPTAFTVTVAGNPVTCAAGTHGFNAIAHTCNPMDDEDHGTHVAGTIGAVGDNGIGVVGINWITRLMAIKFIDASGEGTTEDAIASVEFAIAVKQRFAATGEANIRVLSNSWGGSDFSQALLDEVNAANDADMLFVAGAGNDSFDNDTLPFYPASFDAPNVISVAATDNTDELAWFSNFGTQSVDIGAPGVDILSTTIGNTYQYLSGTSMATPHVSGAAALVLSQCGMPTADLKDTLLGSADALPSLSGLTSTGGRLDVYSALYSCTAPPQTPTNLKARGGDTQVMLSWSSALGATRYTLKRSLTSGGPYSSMASAIHATEFVDTNVANGTKYYYVVSATNSLGESSDSNEASATPAIPPDLVVSSFVLPTIGGAGQTLSLAVTVKNQGVGSAAASNTAFYWSIDSLLDPTDIVLAQLTVPPLAAGGINSASVPVVVPSTIAGRYYLIVQADADDVLDERSEANNVIARQIAIGPDLSISALTVPGNGASDSTIVVNDTIKNQGGGAAPVSTTRFYLSTNTLLDAADTLLASRDVAALDPGATNAGSTVMTIPSSAATGTYYVIAKTDADGAVPETNEANNIASRSIVIGSDLVVSTMTVPAKAGSGLMITVTDATANHGGGTASASATRFYLSANSTLAAGDTLLAGSHVVPELAGNASDNGSTTLTLPTVTAGTYYIIANADDDNVVLESKETNNSLAKSIQIGPDLVVSALTVPAAVGAGVPLTVTDTTANQGGGSIAATTTKFYLSLNSVRDAADAFIGSRSVEALTANVGSSGSATLNIPADTLPGTYFVIANADGDNVALETSETNNITSRSVVVGSDLIVSALTVPAKASGNTAITVSDTTTNSGGGAATASVTRFYLSANSVFEPGDTLLSGIHAVGNLGGGASDSAATSLALPSVPAGAYYIIAKADDLNAVLESKETNNTLARSIAIGGDLAVSALTVPPKGGAGSPLTINDTTLNQGGGTVGPTSTKFYLSSNSALDATDTLLGARSINALNSAANSAGSTVVTIPSGTSAGTHYIIAKADADDLMPETIETNNTTARSLVIGSDLTVTVVTPPAKSAPGASIVVTDTTTNQGGGDAPPSVTAFFLSTTSAGGSNDILLDGVRAVPTLAAGASSSGSTTVTIPANAGIGTFYVIAKADNSDLIAESSETNNVRSRSISIGPDLMISSASLTPTSVAAGSPITVTDTVSNQGGGSAGPSATRFYLSINSLLDASDIPLTPSRAAPPLAAGTTSSGSTVVTIPAGTIARTYYVIAQADADAAVAETTETNNTTVVRSLQVTPGP